MEANEKLSNQIIDCLVEAATQVIKAEAGSLLLVKQNRGQKFFSLLCSVESDSENKKVLTFKTALGTKGKDIKKFNIDIGIGIAGWVAENQKPLLVPDVERDSRHNPSIDKLTGFQTRTIICSPLFVRGDTIGVVELINRDDREPFTEDDLESLNVFADKISRIMEFLNFKP